MSRSTEKSIGAGALPDTGNMIIHGQTTWIDHAASMSRNWRCATRLRSRENSD
jgi:hypothetical protein